MRRIIVALFLLIGACMPKTETPSVRETADCMMDSGPCVKMSGGTKVMFDISPKPVTAMHELRFTVTSSKAVSAKSLLVDLSMPGMYMGVNNVILEKNGEGTYTGTGIIPRCPKGHKLWKAEITIPEYGTVSYIFDVGK